MKFCPTLSNGRHHPARASCASHPDAPSGVWTTHHLSVWGTLAQYPFGWPKLPHWATVAVESKEVIIAGDLSRHASCAKAHRQAPKRANRCHPHPDHPHHADLGHPGTSSCKSKAPRRYHVTSQSLRYHNHSFSFNRTKAAFSQSTLDTTSRIATAKDSQYISES